MTQPWRDLNPRNRAGSAGTSQPVLSVFYLVDLGGSGTRPINFYRRHADAEALAHALAGLLRVPVREV